MHGAFVCVEELHVGAYRVAEEVLVDYVFSFNIWGAIPYRRDSYIYLFCEICREVMRRQNVSTVMYVCINCWDFLRYGVVWIA